MCGCRALADLTSGKRAAGAAGAAPARFQQGPGWGLAAGPAWKAATLSQSRAAPWLYVTCTLEGWRQRPPRLHWSPSHTRDCCPVPCLQQPQGSTVIPTCLSLVPLSRWLLGAQILLSGPFLVPSGGLRLSEFLLLGAGSQGLSPRVVVLLSGVTKNKGKNEGSFLDLPSRAQPRPWTPFRDTGPNSGDRGTRWGLPACEDGSRWKEAEAKARLGCRGGAQTGVCVCTAPAHWP